MRNIWDSLEWTSRGPPKKSIRNSSDSFFFLPYNSELVSNNGHGRELRCGITFTVLADHAVIWMIQLARATPASVMNHLITLASCNKTANGHVVRPLLSGFNTVDDHI